MKAKFSFLGLCALALAACPVDEVSQVNDTNAIQFKVTVATRAAATTISVVGVDTGSTVAEGHINAMTINSTDSN